MLQKEFTERTGVSVSAEEYAAIETVYVNSDLDKDEFCKMWKKMNASRVKAAKEAANEAKKDEEAMDVIWSLYNRLQQTWANIRPELAGDFLTEKECAALIRYNIDVWDYEWSCEKDTTMITHEIRQLIDSRAA